MSSNLSKLPPEPQKKQEEKESIFHGSIMISDNELSKTSREEQKEEKLLLGTTKHDKKRSCPVIRNVVKCSFGGFLKMGEILKEVRIATLGGFFGYK